METPNAPQNAPATHDAAGGNLMFSDLILYRAIRPGVVMPDGHQSFRVLVVDDDVKVADSLVQILTATGHQAVAAYSAEAAIKMAEKLNPEAVVSDVVMGPVSGIELTNHIREHYPSCRVLLFSGYASTKAFTQAFLTRGSSVQFLPKPVHPSRILEFLATCETIAPPVPAGEEPLES
jgi:CheY-like chemotaxis protein